MSDQTEAREDRRYAALDTIMPNADPMVRQRLEMAFDAGVAATWAVRPAFESGEAFNDSVRMQTAFYRREIEELKEKLAEYANELEQIVWKVNSDERHLYPDPCLVCESNDDVIAVVEKMRSLKGEQAKVG